MEAVLNEGGTEQAKAGGHSQCAKQTPAVSGASVAVDASEPSADGAATPGTQQNGAQTFLQGLISPPVQQPSDSGLERAVGLSPLLPDLGDIAMRDLDMWMPIANNGVPEPVHVRNVANSTGAPASTSPRRKRPSRDMDDVGEAGGENGKKRRTEDVESADFNLSPAAAHIPLSSNGNRSLIGDPEVVTSRGASSSRGITGSEMADLFLKF